MTLLNKLGLHRPELRAWALYDWANSAMVTTIITAVFPIFYQSVASSHLPAKEATQNFAFLTALSFGVIALLAPFLGTLADYAGWKKKLLAFFISLGVLATAGMFWIQEKDLALASVLFLLANVGFAGSLIFYDSLLPHIAKPNEIDRVSTGGYAIGYLGGGIHLALVLTCIQNPDWFGFPTGDNLTSIQFTLPARVGFLSVSLWWFFFSLPLFFKIPEPIHFVGTEKTERNSIKGIFSQFAGIARELRTHRQAFLFLLAFLVYNDGIGTIIRMAVIYGKEIGIETGSLIAAILLVQFIGIPFTFLFGGLAGKIGTKPAIFFALAVYTGISGVAFFMKTTTHFFILATFVGMVQGGCQALSRSLFASLIPKHKSAKFFALFSVSEKFAGIAGPLIFGLMISIAGSSRAAILSLIIFFVLGGTLLYFVDIEKGREEARGQIAISKKRND